MNRTLVLYGLIAVCGFPSSLLAFQPPDAGGELAFLDGGPELDILDLDLDELANIDRIVPAFDVAVMSVTSNESTIGKSPASIHVITSEMIRRSGKTSVPELLRLVPGLHVARIDSNKWAISARGFGGRFTNKLLVLIDGRSVYTPAFSGVYWDVQDLVLQDIERIEVIRGPGATVWGANAVNGVINVITKHARDTQGTLISAGGGTQDETITAFRYGGATSNGIQYRVYGKHFERDNAFAPDVPSHDDSRQGRIGFRADWASDDFGTDELHVQGQVYSGSYGEHTRAEPIASPPFLRERTKESHVSGEHFLARWTHRISTENSYFVQAYYDNTRRDDLIADQRIDVYDLQFQQSLAASCNQSITWGLRGRWVDDDVRSNNTTAFVLAPAQRQTQQLSAFVQDEIALTDSLTGLIGCKLEHNDYSGFEYQPTARLLWTVDPQRVVWGAVSRAVRTPSRIEDDMRLRIFTAPPATFLQLTGSTAIEAENLMAYEIGYRAQPTDSFAWDAAVFFNDYDDLATYAPSGPPISLSPLVLPYDGGNLGWAEGYGFEVSAQWWPSDDWTLSAWYTFTQLAGHNVFDEAGFEGGTPHNQAFLMSSWDLPRGWEVDVLGQYVDSLPGAGAPSYVSLDVRLGWRPNDAWEFSVVGQNLIDSHRPEYPVDVVNGHSTEVMRGVYAQAVWTP